MTEGTQRIERVGRQTYGKDCHQERPALELWAERRFCEDFGHIRETLESSKLRWKTEAVTLLYLSVR